MLTHTDRGGGSTITQQLAGEILDIRSDISLKRKFIELWSALQLERRYSKQEILEQYLNRVVMGPGVYGVEAASKYFFDHSAKTDNPAESAILAIQLSSPSKYDPYKHPQNAKKMSRELLDKMVKLGYVTKADVDASFNEFWDNFDYTRTTAGAYSRRAEDDKAPWFSEYVRQQLADMLYGSLDIYTDGLQIYTTLDLDQQRWADYWMAKGIDQVNRTYQAESSVEPWRSRPHLYPDRPAPWPRLRSSRPRVLERQGQGQDLRLSTKSASIRPSTRLPSSSACRASRASPTPAPSSSGRAWPRPRSRAPSSRWNPIPAT